MQETMLTAEDVQYLLAFNASLDVFDRDLELAKIIGYHDRADECRHPILAFAFRHAPTAVITHSILRFAEALELHLEQASVQLTGKSLWTGRGRNRRLIDPDFQRLQELRDARVAHGVKLRPRGDAAVQDARQASGTVIDFLRTVVTKFRSLFATLQAAGLFGELENQLVPVPLAKPFTKEALLELIAAGNALVEPAA